MHLIRFMALPTEVETALESITTEISGVFNIGNIISVVTIVFGISLTLGAFWFFGRMLVRKIMGAFKSGKVGL